MGREKDPAEVVVPETEKVVVGAPATAFDPDKTYTVEEMEAHGRYSLVPKEGREVRRTSATAHRFLKENFLGRLPAYKDSILWDSMILSKNLALRRTLNLKEVQELYLQRQAALEKKQVEHEQMLDLREDPTAPTKDEHCFPCQTTFSPMRWNKKIYLRSRELVVEAGSYRLILVDPETGEPSEADNAVRTIAGFCKKDNRRDGPSYTYAKAKSEKERLDREAKLGGALRAARRRPHEDDFRRSPPERDVLRSLDRRSPIR